MQTDNHILLAHPYHKPLGCAIVPYHKPLGCASSIPYACFQTLSSPRRGEMSIETGSSSNRTP